LGIFPPFPREIGGEWLYYTAIAMRQQTIAQTAHYVPIIQEKSENDKKEG